MKRIALISALSLPPRMAMGQGRTYDPLTLNHGIREECRSAVAGYLIGKRGGWEAARANKEHLEHKIKGFKQAIVVYETKLEEQKKIREESGFDLGLEGKVDELKANLKLIQKNLESSEEILVKTTREAEKAKKDLASTEARVKKVFSVRMDPKAKGYGIIVDYPTPCPRYQSNCALEPKVRAALLSLLGTETPLSCRRYAQKRNLEK